MLGRLIKARLRKPGLSEWRAAEGGGFEPPTTVRLFRIRKSGALSHSAIPPQTRTAPALVGAVCACGIRDVRTALRFT
jgi:hypothetical protein